MRNLRLASVIGCVVAGAACGDGSPAAPSPSDLLRPSREPMQIRFDGVFYVPHQVIELRPGALVELHVVAEPEEPSIGLPPPWTSFVVETDAPPDFVSLSREIRSRDVEVTLEPGGDVTAQAFFGVVRIEVREPAGGAGIGQIYELRIAPPEEGFAQPYQIEIEGAPLRFRVTAGDAPIPCDALTLTAHADGGTGRPGRFFSRLFPDATEFHSGRVTLRSSRFGVGMRLLAPYRFRGGELANMGWDPSAQRKQDTTGHPFLFVAGMGLAPDGEGFEQTLDFGWFDDLELDATAPGCEPLRLRCERGSCVTD